MGWDDGGLGRNANTAMAAIALGALLIIGVSLVNSRSPASTETEDDPVMAMERALLDEIPSSDACFDWGTGLSDLPLGPNLLANMRDTLAEDVDGDCLAEGETLIVVAGLPMVSGTYHSRNGNLALEGWSLDEGAQDQPIFRCFVDHDDTFRSKAVHIDGTTLITIDVGRTGEGGPFVAVVRENGSGVTHNYSPGQPDTVEAVFDVWNAQDWTGVAVFTPTKNARTYNERDYSPWTDKDSRFEAPNHQFTIALFCK